MTTATAKLNGIDTDALRRTMEAVKADHRQGIVGFKVTTDWQGSGPRSKTRVAEWTLGGEHLPRDFTIDIDEPEPLLGTNTSANPQEHLMASMNACMLATYVAACSMQGIELEHLSIESSGKLDLRGFLGLDRKVIPGYERIDCKVNIKGNGTQKQFEIVHDWVKNTSPNYFNLAAAVTLNSELVVG